MTLEQIDDAQNLCYELPLNYERLFRCGLLKTGHAMDAVVKVAGYELAEQLEKAAQQQESET